MTDERDDRHDDAFEAFLEHHAGEYNPPPETPRKAMWEAIEASRRERSDEPDEGALPLAAHRRTRWIGRAAAAAAVLALGIGLGRLSLRQDPGPPGAPGPTAATAPSSVDDRDAELDPAARGGDLVLDPSPTAADDPRAPVPARRARDNRDAAPEAGPRELYRLVSTRMLAQAETILVQYRADRRSERIDPAIGRWARDVLSSTRLLLDSPAADDARTRALLEDLELVLAQIVHVAGVAEPGDEAEWLDRTIDDRDMITRLRMAVPLGDPATVGL